MKETVAGSRRTLSEFGMLERMSRDEWEALDNGKAIELASEIWGWRSTRDQVRMVMDKIRHANVAIDEELGREKALVETQRDYEEASDILLDLEDRFYTRYSFNLDELDVHDMDE